MFKTSMESVSLFFNIRVVKVKRLTASGEKDRRLSGSLRSATLLQYSS